MIIGIILALSEQHFQVGACSNGTVYGEGQALITTKDGESISCKGMGVGKLKGIGMGIS